MPLSAIHHLGLTVADVEVSARWYEAVLGFQASGAYASPDGSRRKVFLNHEHLNVRLGLAEHAAGSRAPFDETRIGLDHLAFRVDSETELDEWQERFASHDVEFSPAAPANSIPGALVVVFRDPDNIQLELFFDPSFGGRASHAELAESE